MWVDGHSKIPNHRKTYLLVARICWFTVDIYMELSKKIKFFMCESLVTTIEVTDAQENRNNSFQVNKLVELWSARYAQTAPLLCSVKSSFTTLVNKRAMRNISTPCVVHRHALASKAPPEYLKIVLKHVPKRVDFIRHGLVFSKCFIKIQSVL